MSGTSNTTAVIQGRVNWRAEMARGQCYLEQPDSAHVLTTRGVDITTESTCPHGREQGTEGQGEQAATRGAPGTEVGSAMLRHWTRPRPSTRAGRNA